LLPAASGTLFPLELHAASAQHTKPRPTFLASVVLVRMICRFSSVMVLSVIIAEGTPRLEPVAVFSPARE
jgi:hypothetical protein